MEQNEDRQIFASNIESLPSGFPKDRKTRPNLKTKIKTKHMYTHFLYKVNYLAIFHKL